MTEVTLAPGAELWRDTTRSARERAEALLAELTLEEKAAQLGSIWLTESADDFAPRLEGDLAVTEGDAFAGGLGQLTRVFGTEPISVAEGVRRLRELQARVVAGQRLGIPALAHEECLTGLAAFGATAYPTPLAWAATFDEEIIGQMARRIGTDMRSLGIHQGLAPVLDVVKDYRWGRVEETLGEDPYLVGQLAAAYVAGLESTGIIATLKHFAGYSASRGARNHGPVSMGPREFADTVLPPFETALRHGGARSVMTSYTDVDGVPCSSNAELLTGVLREQWGFEGTVVADYWAVPFLVSMHRVAADADHAGAMALSAGLDVELPQTVGYAGLARLVREGRIAPSDLDTAVLRHLEQKIAAGLLDSEHPVPVDAEKTDLDSAANREISERIAEESIVLLRNDRVLPLEGTERICIIGPAAEEYRSLLGCYSFPNHVLTKHPGHDPGISIPTVAAAIQAEFARATIAFERGCDIEGTDAAGIPAAVEAARRSDVAVLVVGDVAGLFGAGTSGEGCDAADLTLPGRQHELVRAVLETGTPVVLVVLSGRPYALGEYSAARAIVQAFFPGAEGARAVAGVLSGRVATSGRLPVQIPRIPSASGTYLQPVLGRYNSGITVADPRPMFPFGFGLTPGEVVYESVTTPSELPTDGAAEVSVVVHNRGESCVEVVQLYASYPVSPIVRPATQLIGFARVDLSPGARRRVRFSLDAGMLAATGADGALAVEPGPVVIVAAPSADNERCSAHLTLTGPRHVRSHRVLRTPWDITDLESES